MPTGEDPVFNKVKEEGKGSMLLTISMVDRQFDPGSDPLKLGVLAWESKRDLVISTVIRYIMKDGHIRLLWRKCYTTGSWLIHSRLKKDAYSLGPA